MPNILLISHSNLSKELYNTSSFILGEHDESVSYMTLNYNDDINLFYDQVYELVSKCEEVLILVDLFGGTPFNTCAKVYGKLKNKIPIKIVTGMNLPMVIEVVTNKDKNLEELSKLARSCGQSGIKEFPDN